MGPYGANSMRHNQNFANEWGVFSNVTQEFKRRRRWVKKIYDLLFYGTFMVMVFTTWMIFCLHKYEQITPSVMNIMSWTQHPSSCKLAALQKTFEALTRRFGPSWGSHPPPPSTTGFYSAVFLHHTARLNLGQCVPPTLEPLQAGLRNPSTWVITWKITSFYLVFILCACVCACGGESHFLGLEVLHC